MCRVAEGVQYNNNMWQKNWRVWILFCELYEHHIKRAARELAYWVMTQAFWLTNHRKYYVVMPYSRVANTEWPSYRRIARSISNTGAIFRQFSCCVIIWLFTHCSGMCSYGQCLHASLVLRVSCVFDFPSLSMSSSLSARSRSFHTAVA